MTDRYGQAGFEADQAARLQPLVDRLRAWFRDGPPQLRSAAITSARFPEGGASSDLVLLDVEHEGRERGFAVRFEPRHAVYPDVDLGRQFRCGRAAHEHGPAPVPATLWHEPDPAAAGAPFVVSECIDGTAGTFAFEERVAASPASDQAQVWRDGIALVAAIHATDIVAAGLHDRLGAGDTPVDRYLDYWRRFRAFVDDGREQPVLDAALEHLETHRPAVAPTEALVWGDARFGNVLYRDLRPVAALDLEFAHVGLPELDVAFFALFARISFEYFRPSRLPSGFGDLDETFDLYESLTGRCVTDRRWFLVLAGTYSALAVTRVMQPRAAAGLVPEAMVVAHPPMRALADVLEMDVPEAAS